MNQSELIELDATLLETLFHELAREGEVEIVKLMHCSKKTVYNRTSKLMTAFCPGEKVDITLLLSVVMADTELIRFLVEKFEKEFPSEVRRIRRRYEHRLETKVVDGKKRLFVRSWVVEPPVK
jgi:hypothetical protein